MRWPGVIKPGSSVSRLMLNIDWAPTLLDIAGVKAPSEVQGTSIVPLLKGSAAGWRKAMYYHYYEFPQPHHVYPHFGVRTERYKLARFYAPSDSWELYDLVTDPHEVHNLYGKAEYAGLIRTLKGQLRDLIRQYKDVEADKILSERP
jgi:arylsulfatase A-like enzyme